MTLDQSNQPPNKGDERGADRVRMFLRTAKLVCSDGEYLCVLRDASVTGFRAKIYHRLPHCQGIELELGSQLHYRIDKVWENGGEAGFKFAEKIDLEKFINELGPYPKRGVRLRISMPSRIRLGVAWEAATIRNISQQGARIVTRRPLMKAQRLQLEIDATRCIDAQVRWCDGDSYGLVFDDTFRFDELAQLAERLQREYRDAADTGVGLDRQPRIEVA